MSKTEDNKKILIIDDEEGLREGCRRVLERYSYEVDLAATGHEGMTRILAAHYSVVLLDVIMPDINGLELLQHIHSYAPGQTCIIITAFATVELAVQAMKLGAYDFLAKPFSDDALLEAVERALDKHRLLQEATQPPLVVGRFDQSGRETVTLEELEHATGASMRKVAHELRAPLAAIRSFLTLILQGYTTPEKTRDMQQRAAERADDLLGLIDDLLNLARLKDHRVTSAPEIVSLETILKDVLSFHAPEVEAKDLRLKTDIRACPSIVADPVHIKQLWTNLISNAIKYTPRGQRVTVRLFSELGGTVGVVEDTGIGIAREDQAHLFEEFFRTEQAKALSQHGTGLGLSIVKQIVQQYGGTIGVESQLGKGTRFTFRLPAGDLSAPGC